VQEVLRRSWVSAPDLHTVAVIVDLSGSMERYLDAVQSALGRLRRLFTSSQVFVFSEHVRRWTEADPPLRKMFQSEFGQRTALVDAAVAGMRSVAAGRAPHGELFVISDGCENQSLLSADAARALAVGEGVDVRVIAIGHNTCPKTLDALSGRAESRSGDADVGDQIADAGFSVLGYYDTKVVVTCQKPQHGAVASRPPVTTVELGIPPSSFVVSAPSKRLEATLEDETAVVLDAFFAHNEHKPRYPASVDGDLEAVGRILIANPTLHVVLDGYASTPGTLELNDRLSCRRANEIRKMLHGRIQNQVNGEATDAAGRVHLDWFGERVLPAGPDQDDKAKQQLNRRVTARFSTTGQTDHAESEVPSCYGRDAGPG
jgi:outer membrane protein OmpA-like peptidoglycan-associated protein